MRLWSVKKWSCRFLFFLLISSLGLSVMVQSAPAFAKARSPLDPFVNTVLPNGLALFVKEVHTTPIVAVDIWVDTGAINDPTDQAGLSHFLEHMIFKGTPRRTAADIANVIGDAGGVMNAGTSISVTHYYFTVPSAGFDTTLDVWADAIINPAFRNEDIEKERKVILEEKGMSEDSPFRKLSSMADQAMFADTPFGKDILGTPETLARISHDQLATYFQKYYAPNNMVIAVVGDIAASKVMARVRELFKDLKQRNVPGRPEVKIPELRAIKRLEVNKPVDQTYLYMGFPLVKVEERDYDALVVLGKILGWGDGSRLNQELNEKRKLVNAISTQLEYYPGMGLLSVYAQSQGTDVSLLEKTICDELRRIADKGVSQAELDRAKALIRYNNIYAMDSVSDMARIFGISALNNDLDGLIYATHEPFRVSQAEVKQAARKYLDVSVYAMAVIKPQEVK